MAIQDAGGGDLAAMQAELRAPVSTGPWWMPIGLKRLRLAAEEERRRGIVNSFQLPIYAQQLQDMQLASKQQRATLAGLNDFAVGHGTSFGALQAQMGMAGFAQDMAKTNLLNQQAKSVAFELQEAGMSVEDRLQRTMDAIGKVFGVPGEDLAAAQQTMTAVQNGMAARDAQRVQSFMKAFGVMEQRASQMAGYGLNLFGNADSARAAESMEKLLAQSPDMTEDEAFQAILQQASGIAQQKFMQLTTPQGPSPLPEQLISGLPKHSPEWEAAHAEAWANAVPSPLQQSIVDFLKGPRWAAADRAARRGK